MSRRSIFVAFGILVIASLLGYPRTLAVGTPPTSFAPNEDWTHGPYFGSRGTFFADVDGDARADAIVVNNDTVTVRRSDGSKFLPNEDWTHGPYFGSRGTFFIDVTGDQMADAIVVNDDTVTVRRATRTCFIFWCWNYHFDKNEDWTHGPYFGSVGTFFADVDGDGKADAIVVNADTVTVRRSDGSKFLPNEDWTHGPFQGTIGTFFFDINGDGKADAIAVNGPTPQNPSGSVIVRPSTGSSFGPSVNFLAANTGSVRIGSQDSIAFAMSDAWSNRLPLMLDVSASGVLVRESSTVVPPSPPVNSNILSAPINWTGGPYFGTHGIFFADVTGDCRPDAIVVNNDTVTVRRASPQGTSSGQLCPNLINGF